MPYHNGDYAVRAGDLASDRDFQLALVVGTSQINRIVVSRIAETAGLKALTGTPEEAVSLLAERLPGVVILDGGADDRECERLMDSLAITRQPAAASPPFVILLSTTTTIPGDHPGRGAIDAVVAKPITPEKLQPLIQRHLERVRS